MSDIRRLDVDRGLLLTRSGSHESMYRHPSRLHASAPTHVERACATAPALARHPRHGPGTGKKLRGSDFLAPRHLAMHQFRYRRDIPVPMPSSRSGDMPTRCALPRARQQPPPLCRPYPRHAWLLMEIFRKLGGVLGINRWGDCMRRARCGATCTVGAAKGFGIPRCYGLFVERARLRRWSGVCREMRS